MIKSKTGGQWFQSLRFVEMHLLNILYQSLGWIFLVELVLHNATILEEKSRNLWLFLHKKNNFFLPTYNIYVILLKCIKYLTQLRLIKWQLRRLYSYLPNRFNFFLLSFPRFLFLINPDELHPGISPTVRHSHSLLFLIDNFSTHSTFSRSHLDWWLMLYNSNI